MYVDWPSHLVVRQSEVRISPKLGTSSWQHLFLNLLALVFPRHRSMHIPCRSPPLQSDLFPCPFRFHPGLSISYAFHHRASPPRISEGPFLLPRPPPSCASQGVARPSFPPQKWRFHPSRETVRVVLAAAAAVRVPPRNPIPMQGHRGRIDRGRTRGSPPLPGSWDDPGFPRTKGEVECRRSEGSRGGANPGPGGREGDPLPMGRKMDTARRGKGWKREISSTRIGRARVSWTSEEFPQGRSDSPRGSSRGNGIHPLVGFSPSSQTTRSRGEEAVREDPRPRNSIVRFPGTDNHERVRGDPRKLPIT